MITIINYGLGNVRALANIYNELNIPFIIAKQPDELKKATKLILPGVGAFDKVIYELDKSGMRQTLEEMVLHHRIPILGICVGMQILARSSEEGKCIGLGWIDAEVKRFNFSNLDSPLRIPHMGWNHLKPIKPNPLLQGLETDARFYFLHSYYFRCNRDADIIAVADYGGKFACAVNADNIFGVQFHPEKSHQWGIRLLENFGKL